MSAMELAEVVRARHASSQEVIEAHLRRIDDVNPATNAVTVVLAEQALDAAKAADHAVIANHDGEPLGCVSNSRRVQWRRGPWRTCPSAACGRGGRRFPTRQSLLRAWGEFQETHALIVAPICSRSTATCATMSFAHWRWSTPMSPGRNGSAAISRPGTRRARRASSRSGSGRCL